MTHPTLGRRASFWVAAAIVCHTLWTSAAPAMTYRLYAEKWQLTPTIITAIFAVYPIVVVAVLVLFGNLSDFIGRRKTMLYGLVASLTGVLLFAIAPSVTWIFVGRVFMGIGVGLTVSPSTAALVEFSAPGKADRAGAILSAAQSAGLAFAMLVGGGLIEYAPFPTHLNFWVLAVVLAALFAVAWFLPHHTPNEAAGPWKMRVPHVPGSIFKIFITATSAVASSYALGAMMLSLGGQIEHDLIGSGNALVNGSVMAAFAVIVGIVAILAKQLSSRFAIISGGFFSVAGMGLLMLSASQHSLLLFLCSITAAGIGYSLTLLGGLNLINAAAPVHHRASTLSALYLIAYLAQGGIALALGKAATILGLATGIQYGAIVIGLCGILTAGLAARFIPKIR